MKFVMAVYLFALITAFASFSHAQAGGTTGAQQRRTVDASITAGTTTSAALDLGTGIGAFNLHGVFVTGTPVGTSISFTAAPTLTGTYVPVFSSAGSALTYAIGANTYRAFALADLQGLRFIKIVSNATETAGLTLTVELKSGAN